MKTSCWHFTKNDCCFWSLYKNNRSVLIKSKTEAFFLSLNVASFFFYDTNMFACGKQKKLKYYFGERKNVLWDCVLVEKRYNTSAENNVLREGVWSKKDIILRRKKNVFWDCVWSKRYNNSPTKNIVFWSKKDIKLRRKKMFSETVKKDMMLRRKKSSSMFYCCLLPNKLFAST